MEVKVSAPGYEDWVYPDPAIPSQVLRMDPGSEIHLEIQLKPAHDRRLLVSKFLIPEGYIGWLRVEYDVACFPSIPVEDGVRILRFAGSNVLETSSPMPEDAAERQYFSYAADGSERNLAADYRNGNGMIWRETPGSRGGNVYIFCRDRRTVQDPTTHWISASCLSVSGANRETSHNAFPSTGFASDSTLTSTAFTTTWRANGGCFIPLAANLSRRNIPRRVALVFGTRVAATAGNSCNSDAKGVFATTA